MVMSEIPFEPRLVTPNSLSPSITTLLTILKNSLNCIMAGNCLATVNATVAGVSMTVSPPDGLLVTRRAAAATASVHTLDSTLFDWPSTMIVSCGCQTIVPVVPSLNRKASGRSYSESVTAMQRDLLAIFIPCSGEKLLQIK